MCSSQLSYPRVWRKRQESNLRLQVISLVLSMSYILILRLAEHGHASRAAPVRCESLNTRPCEGGAQVKAKQGGKMTARDAYQKLRSEWLTTRVANGE